MIRITKGELTIEVDTEAEMLLALDALRRAVSLSPWQRDRLNQILAGQKS